MNLQCRKCGQQIEVPTEALSVEQPRVVCPGCSTRYRLRPRSSDGGAAGMDSTGAAPEAAESAATLDDTEGATHAEDSATPASGISNAVADASGPIFQPGQVVAERYRVVRFLAQGGMGEVYEAEDVELLQAVALKTISARMGEESGVLDRFKREIALARTVTHPNVCRIFDLGTHRARADGETHVNFLTMELLRGETLAELLRRRHRLSTDEALPLIEQMCAGLDAAHRARVVHRDLKSENVFLEGSSEARDLRHCRVVLTDFGVARGTDGGDRFASQVTGLGIVGTPAYMAPEQVENKVITSKADLYALGIVIYEMVTGCLPFDAESPLTTAVKRLREPPPPPHVHVPDLPAWWERAILRCLERRPDDRFADALSVARALERPVRPMAAGSTAAGTTATGATAAGTTMLHPARVHPVSTRNPPPGRPANASATTRFDAARPEPGTRAPGSGSNGARVENGSSPAGPSPAAGTAAGSVGNLPRRAVSTARRSTNWLLVALLLVLGGSGVLIWFNADDGVDPSRVQLRRSVAVLGFENLSGRNDVDWLSTALAEMLQSELARGKSVRTVSGTRVSQALLEADIGGLHELDVPQLGRLRRLLACDFVVAGSYVSLGGQGISGPVRLDIDVHDAAVGTKIATLAEQGPADELFAVVGRVGDGLRDALGVGGKVDDPMSGVPRDPAANRLYAQALDALRESNAERARELLQQAAAAEPDNALVHSALAAVWEALGFSTRAIDEARLAFERSSNLSREDRLVVEGRYRLLAGEWTAAQEVFRHLWQAFPDTLDYGLGLVDALIGGERIDEALTTLEALRQLPPPLSTDPRIHLAEAHAAGRGGRLEQQQQAADRAAAEATRLGAEIWLAQARLAQSQAQRLLGEPREAAASATAARDIFRRLDHPEGHALALNALANALLDLGELADAREGYEQAAYLYRSIGDREGRSASLNNLAVLLKKQGDLEGAQQLYAKNEAIYRELGDTRGLANTLNNLAVLLVERDRLGEALELLDRAHDTWQGLGAAGQAYNLNNTAEVLRQQGDLDTARARHEEALSLRTESGRKLDQLISLANLAGLLLDRGEITEARGRLGAATSLAESVEDPAARALVLFQQARLSGHAGDLEAAAATHEQALALRRNLGHQGSILASRLALARLDLDTELPARAELLAREVRAEASRDDRRADAVRASAILVEALLDDQRLDEAVAASDEAEAYGEAENVEARLELALARTRLSGSTAGPAPPSSDLEQVLATFEHLATQAADHHLRPLALRIRLQRAEFLLRHSTARRDEVLGQLRVLETEARAAGLLFHAQWAAELIKG